MRLGKRRDDDLQRQLRAARPQPRREFVRRLAIRVMQPARPRLVPRLVLVGALTGGLLLAVASMGGVSQGTRTLRHLAGLSQASSERTLQARERTPQASLPASPAVDPSTDQYNEGRKACKKTEQARHRNAQKQETQTHKANLRAIRALPRDQRKAARKAEQARHRAAVKAEIRLHKRNQRTCNALGRQSQTPAACKRSELARHRSALKQEARTHKTNTRAVAKLPDKRQKGAKKAEQTRHRTALRVESRLHKSNVRACNAIGSPSP